MKEPCRLFHLAVGAGFARPKTPTALLFEGAFGQATPAPTGILANADIHFVFFPLFPFEKAIFSLHLSLKQKHHGSKFTDRILGAGLLP